jgi:preprotein translocase subunit YajC
MFNSIAHAAGQGGGGNPIGAFLPLILIFVIFYFLLIRPQQKRQKQHQQMLESIKVGDEVILSSGIYGRIERVVDQNSFMVEIANGVKVKITKNAIATKVTGMNTTSEKEK